MGAIIQEGPATSPEWKSPVFYFQKFSKINPGLVFFLGLARPSGLWPHVPFLGTPFLNSPPAASSYITTL